MAESAPGERFDMKKAAIRRRFDAVVRLVVRRKIIGPDWEFPVGMKLAGMKCGTDGRWRVWPHGQDYAFLVGVPRWYVKREKPNNDLSGGR